MTEMVHFHVTLNMRCWQGRLCILFARLGWRRPAHYFADCVVERAVERAIHEMHGGPP
jgi:hypothetical protein